MNKNEAKALLKLSMEENARRTYLGYCELTNGEGFIVGKHIKYICDKVDKFYESDYKYLLVDMPPQHGKSTQLTETLGAYRMDKYGENVILASYGDDLARRFGRANRQKLKEFSLYGNTVTRDSDTDIGLSNGGYLISRGIMAGITGQSADTFIIDDPIKNRQEADSETYRNRLWEEFIATVNTRLSAKGKVIIIQTRWHEDDLIGKLLSEFSDMCMQIHIPLEAEENDVLGRAVGDALFPEIGKDNAWLKEFKRLYVGPSGIRTWNALMQGRPSSAEGNILKRDYWRRFTVTPKVVNIMPIMAMSVDATFKDKKTSDFVSIGIWGKSGANYYLIDGVKRRMGFIDTIKMIKTLLIKYPMIRYKYVEDKANGSAILEVLNIQLGGFIGVNPNGDKVSRVEAVSSYAYSGNVYICDDSFGDEFIDECANFPNGKHDDQVDMFSQAISQLLYKDASHESSRVNDPNYPTQEEYDEGNSGLFTYEPVTWKW